MKVLGEFTRISVFLLALLVVIPAVIDAQSIELDFDFIRGAQGWSGGFADYTPLYESEYQLFAGIRYMPRKLTHVPSRSVYIQGNNNSADLFMFLKRRLTAADGVAPGRTYRIEFTIDFASQAPIGCVGAGASPGEGVILKSGASPVEPLAVLQPNGYLKMNVDKGDINSEGPAGSNMGDITNGLLCEEAPMRQFVLVRRYHQHTYSVTANPEAELWLLVGTDSTFEGPTRLYYKRIQVKLTPV